MSKPQKIVVVGAGPVGALAALYAALRGHHVEIYELRSDLRDLSTVPLNFTRSINLALSERGINSIRQTGCEDLLDSVIEDAIPMYGRMIHGRKDGNLYSEAQRYDAQGRYINAIDRAGLNKRLLDELKKHANVSIFFNHKLTGADFNRNTAWFEVRDPSSKYSNERRAPEISVSFDLMIGADGAHSAVRFHLMKFARMTYTQEYIDTLWCEFTIPPSTETMHQTSERTGFRLSPNHLHIWPAGEFMFIAIASLDGSFTCTLFTTTSMFGDLESGKTDLVQFFHEHFPGVVGDLIQPDALRQQFKDNPHLPLISIKCSPHSYGSSGVIVGDAAHAMVPFYGQGMNAGLEDVRVLFEHLDASTWSGESATSARTKALAAYTADRTPDAHTINDLAMGNYQEMRSDVRSPLYLLRKSVEEKLSIWAPWTGFATQYSRISFGNARYSEVERLARWQGRLLGWVGSTLSVLGVALGSGSAWWLGRRR